VLELACDDTTRLAAAKTLLDRAITIADAAPVQAPLVIDRIDGRQVKL
jgi:hypothetical protein